MSICVSIICHLSIIYVLSVIMYHLSMYLSPMYLSSICISIIYVSIIYVSSIYHHSHLSSICVSIICHLSSVYLSIIMYLSSHQPWLLLLLVLKCFITLVSDCTLVDVSPARIYVLMCASCLRTEEGMESSSGARDAASPHGCGEWTPSSVRAGRAPNAESSPAFLVFFSFSSSFLLF